MQEHCPPTARRREPDDPALERPGPAGSEDRRNHGRRHAVALGDPRRHALVAFGTGVGGFPLEEAARIEAEEVQRHLAAGSGLERIVFAVHGAAAADAFRQALGHQNR
ncbi:MAG TPA: hypothetical protein VFH80_25485 [Solirubrobacteraceae bacterium]|nr:hypothetical protein [Solirubrobacteraceae bacterium]